jgi:acylphosphatase
VQRRARTLGVAGWARNEPDGSVAVFAEGAPEAVEALVEFCRSGPRGAEVERVDVEEVEPHGLASFEVC